MLRAVRTPTRPLLRSLPPLVVAVALAGVVGAACQAFRPYPPDFHYVTDSQVRTAMDRIARDVVELERLLGRHGVLPDERDEIVALLADIHAQAESIGGAGVKTNHPLIDEQLPRFLSQVSAARRAAEAEPPNYYLAGTVSGACIACHRTR